MPRFEVLAVDADGHACRRVGDAQSPSTFIASLEAVGLFVLRIEQPTGESRRFLARGRSAHLPVKDVMAAGGWLDVDPLLKSYQQADRTTLLRVMNEPRKLSDAVA